MARKWKVIKTFKALGDVRGETNENLALEAFINHVKRRQIENRRAYYWLSKVRLKTPEEDYAGVDIVLETTKGNYGINVKSSNLFAWKHEKRFPNIPVIIVDGTSDLDTAVHNILVEIYNTYIKGNRGGGNF